MPNISSAPAKFFQQRLRSFVGEIALYGNILSVFILAPNCPIVIKGSHILSLDDLIQDPVNVSLPVGGRYGKLLPKSGINARTHSFARLQPFPFKPSIHLCLSKAIKTEPRSYCTGY